MSVDQDLSGTSSVRASHRFDVERIAQWLTENIANFRGPLTVEQFKGGQSNPTYKLLTPTKNYVLRRKPPGTTLQSAHAVDREARVLRALEPTGFSVPHVYALCTDDGIIGTWFYVMDCVIGRNIWDATFPDVKRATRPRYFDAMNIAIAELHSLDFRQMGLADFGKTGDYLNRQIGRWTKQYLADADAGRDANLDRLIEWLPAHVPVGDETSLIHGDFRVDNLIFHPEEARVTAVLDWELSTLGHPLADFANHVMMYRMPPTLIAGLLGADLKALNIPSESEYVAAYCQRTSRDGIPHLDFYIAFNMFRLAAIFHGIKGRLIRGNASSAHAEKMVTALPVIAQRAWEQALAARL
jgi:aminoglycoside phosphotransferase (APT) family kinase protein